VSRAERRAAAAEQAEQQGYDHQVAQLADATVPRARYIIEQQKATLPDTPFSRGVLRATAEYLREASTEPEAGQ
jgi:hypothetical protein